MPGGSSTMLYRPSSPEVEDRSSPVCVLVAFTAALGTAAPWLSVTIPAICPELACDWAMAAVPPRPIHSISTRAQSEWNGFRFDIFLPLLTIKCNHFFLAEAQSTASTMLIDWYLTPVGRKARGESRIYLN